MKLEGELNDTKKAHSEEMRFKEDSHSKLIEELKDEMERTISVSATCLSRTVLLSEIVS